MNDADYTPTDNEVWFVYSTKTPELKEQRAKEFERWLAQHDRKVAEQVVVAVADRIEPLSGIGLANHASRAEIADWVRTKFLEPLRESVGPDHG